MIRPGYFCPNCWYRGDIPEIMIFSDNRVVEVECECCNSKIKYTIKAEVVK